MKKKNDKSKDKEPNIFEKISLIITKFAGSTTAFIMALSVILAWGITGPIFKCSDTWQLVINTGTTIITFLMVFLIQRTQNKDSLAMQIKLNEIVAALQGASNTFLNIEELSEKELQSLHERFEKLARVTRRETDSREKQNNKR
jgi:low affinity Fe/Cu permease